eukprot:10091831-Heterocapsa_arctica.AAC.1
MFTSNKNEFFTQEELSWREALSALREVLNSKKRADHIKEAKLMTNGKSADQSVFINAKHGPRSIITDRQRVPQAMNNGQVLLYFWVLDKARVTVRGDHGQDRHLMEMESPTMDK